MLREGGADDATRLAFAFRTVTSRAPEPHELNVLLSSLERFRTSFEGDAAGSEAFAGGLKAAEGAQPKEIASFTAMAHLILNLDETITKN